MEKGCFRPFSICLRLSGGPLRDLAWISPHFRRKRAPSSNTRASSETRSVLSECGQRISFKSVPLLAIDRDFIAFLAKLRLPVAHLNGTWKGVNFWPE
ncbi:hypothetical protein NPIL_64391, partial [Nephila pilipes]